MSDPLVTTAWLADRLGDAAVQVVDTSWKLPAPDGSRFDARAAYRDAHIPGAVFFDIDAISDTSSPLPHMLPSPEAFGAAVGALGLRDDATIVVYDQFGVTSAARVWWTFRAMGHVNVVVLDGGLPKWFAESRPVEDGAPSPAPARYAARLRPELVRDLAQVRAVLDDRATQVVDARPTARFRGEAPEPRPGLRGGHMPRAFSLPAATLATPDGTLPPPDALRTLFVDAGVDLDRPIVTTCGSGITASLLALALARLGRDDVAVYDGSWSEWGAHADTPVVTGA